MSALTVTSIEESKAVQPTVSPQLALSEVSDSDTDGSLGEEIDILVPPTKLQILKKYGLDMSDCSDDEDIMKIDLNRATPLPTPTEVVRPKTVRKRAKVNRKEQPQARAEEDKENVAPAPTRPMRKPKVANGQTMSRKEPKKSDGSIQEPKRKPTASRPTVSKKAPAARRQPKKAVDPNAYDPRAIAVAIPKGAHRREEVSLKRYTLSDMYGTSDIKRQRF